MADTNERVNVDTDQAITNVDDLSDSLSNADDWFDKTVAKANTLDQQTVDVPVETPGAKEAATDLDQFDQKARAAGEGAKVGVSSISDMAGPFGEASGAASTFGQSIEGVAGLAESMAGKLGLSEDATAKMTAGLGIAAVAIGAAAAAWTIYNASQDAAKKGADEVRTALGSVYDKLREGDAQAAAQTFLDTMGDKVEKFRALVGGSVSKADIAGAMFGDPASIEAVDTAVGKLDGTTRLLAESGVKILKQSWTDAKAAADENIALESKVAGFLGNVQTGADTAATSVDKVTAAYGGLTAASAKLPVGASWDVIGNPNSTLDFDPAKFAAAGGKVTNIFPPANTPLAVEQAQQTWDRLQGPR